LIELENAQAEFTRAAENTDWRGLTIADAIISDGAAVKSKIDELGRASFSQPDATKVKDIEERLTKLSTAATELRALAKELPLLKAANDALAQREPFLTELEPPRTTTPSLHADAMPLFAGGQIDLVALTERLERVRAQTALVRAWKSHEKIVSHHRGEYNSLDPSRFAGNQQLERLYEKTVRDLSGVAARLWEVTQDGQFSSEEIDTDLAEVHEDIHELQAIPRRPLHEAVEYVRARTLQLSRDAIDLAS
jgi:hypothetical protein